MTAPDDAIPDEVLDDIAVLKETLDVSDEPQTPHEVVTDAITEVSKLRSRLRHADPAYLRRKLPRSLAAGPGALEARHEQRWPARRCLGQVLAAHTGVECTISQASQIDPAGVLRFMTGVSHPGSDAPLSLRQRRVRFGQLLDVRWRLIVIVVVVVAGRNGAISGQDGERDPVLSCQGEPSG
jgi:hypothetical protein